MRNCSWCEKPCEGNNLDGCCSLQCKREMNDYVDTLNTKRVQEKQIARDEDARAIALGEKTIDEVRQSNAAFAFPKDRLVMGKPKKWA